ncbi:aspartate-semialdehyde dehydrogenase [Tautonia sociabilis]|uniref:Aspartate-semialdehyde dehydrogenase n=1 Tax=Tautonia sociabilis TaxID=2080755 RepID=A0A432MKU3_9BACT|nr:aspartate-semialdehyde dehydrogenase [Tautonia sociabilis]RUL88043.1 aspartate-semialdehyde dehydrogenase [Tautonia sociabilis]
MKNVAVVGATGAVGARMVRLLEERSFPVGSIKFLASDRGASERRVVRFKGEEFPVEPVSDSAFEGVEIVLSSTPASVSRQWSPRAAQAGAVVVDNSSAFRMDPEVPLVVPEVNAHDIPRHQGIIANPNCSTIQMVVALKPLHDAARVRRVIVSTYQSVSGAGQTGLSELEEQLEALVQKRDWPAPSKFAHPIAGNCLPQIDVFLPDGYTKEERKMIDETCKIMGDPAIEVVPTCVRVPVPYSHSESILVETERPLCPEEARALWSAAPGVTVLDDPDRNAYPLAADAEGHDDVFVGRIRRDPFRPNALLFWCVSDNLRKGAATNAVQIAEELVKLQPAGSSR